MEEHKGCKHLDYNERLYPSCTLIKEDNGWCGNEMICHTKAHHKWYSFVS